ncbi:MAG: hypothetical protein MI861_10100, partial [Pirellulales bacterium]|nr:hypothetical protein [Pirellulales bacterium]
AMSLHAKKIGKRVLVLSTDFWTQVVSMPLRSVVGLSTTDLMQTLKFEVETLSGVGAFDSQLAYRELTGDGEHQEFWICQAESLAIASIEDAIAARGAKLAGCCHPAGVPQPFGDARNWSRLEYWPNTVGLVQSDPGKLFLADSDPNSDRWRTGLAAWLGTGQLPDVTENLVGPGVDASVVDDPVQLLSVAKQPDCERWLRAWANQVRMAVNQIPLLVPPKKAIAQQTRLTAAWLVAGIVMVLCAAHQFYLRRGAQALAGQIVALKQPADQKRQTDREVKELNDELSELQTQLSAAQQAHRSMASVRIWQTRLAVLLDRIATCCSEELMVERLDTDSHGLALTGTSLTPDAATQFAAGLRPQLLPHGWRVEPPTQTGRSRWVNGGPWSFQVKLREIAPETPTVSPVAQTDGDSVGGAISFGKAIPGSNADTLPLDQQESAK